MTIGSHEYRLIKNLEDDAARMGLKLLPSKQFGAGLALIPVDDNYPMYSRDAEIAVGSVEYLKNILQGWEKAYSYYSMLGLVSALKVKKAEDRYRQDRLAKYLKTGEDNRSEG